MFENIATKIKYAAKALMILGVFGSFGLFVVVLMEVSLLMGILSLLCGIVSTWILSCLVYGLWKAHARAQMYVQAYAQKS